MSKKEEIVKSNSIHVHIPRHLLNRCFNAPKIRKNDPHRIRVLLKEAETALNRLRHIKSVAEVLILRHDIRIYSPRKNK